MVSKRPFSTVSGNVCLWVNLIRSRYARKTRYVAIEFVSDYYFREVEECRVTAAKYHPISTERDVKFLVTRMSTNGVHPVTIVTRPNLFQGLL